jgi:hypothetical protein
MAWYHGTYSCGHDGRTNIIGPTKNRQWISDRHFEKLCPECHEKQLQEQREKANVEAAEKAKEMELPELTGTEKQVAWANTLRQTLIEGTDKLGKKEMECIGSTESEKYDVLNYIISQAKASWFIDNRSSLLLTWIENRLPEIRNRKAAEKEAPIAHEIKNESTVHPKNEISPVSVEIKVTDEKITAAFEKNDKFRDLVKKLDYEWGNGYWFRKITNTNGPASDRAAELGNKLLNAGFPITLTDSIIKENAISGNYAPEQTKWIRVRSEGVYAGWLTIWWKEKDDRIYKRARSLPGSKWSSPSVVVRIEHYKEVLEFSELYGFEVSPIATKAIEEYKERLKNVAVVSLVPILLSPSPDGLKEILNSGDEILEDLREDD